MGFGIWKLLLLLAVVLVIFGSGKLPNAIKDIGKGLRSLKDELKGEPEDKSEDPKTIVINPKKNNKPKS